MRATIDDVEIYPDNDQVCILVHGYSGEKVQVTPGVARLFAAAIIEAAKEAENYGKK